MILRLSPSLRPDRAAMGARWLVLMVILFGAIISSVGGTNSHGIAAIAATLYAAPASSDTGHWHAHVAVEDELQMVSHGMAGDHSHHAADHSHDKAHAPPAAWNSAPPQLPEWFGSVRPWIELVEASRLERPPMG